MLKLNLLPASFKQRGTVQAAAFLVLIIWLIALAALAVYALSIVKAANNLSDHAQQQAPTNQQVDQYTADTSSYNSQYAAIQPETQFLKDVRKEPMDIADVMRQVARATSPGIVIENYTITPGSPNLKLSALALDYRAYVNWRHVLLTDPGYTGIPQLTGLSGASSSGGASGGYPGGGGASGYPGGSGGAGGGASKFSYPVFRFPGAISVTADVTLAVTPIYPKWPPGGAASAGAAASPGGGGGTFGAPGGGSGYPAGGGTGYPGGGGPTGPPAGGSSSSSSSSSSAAPSGGGGPTAPPPGGSSSSSS